MESEATQRHENRPTQASHLGKAEDACNLVPSGAVISADLRLDDHRRRKLRWDKEIRSLIEAGDSFGLACLPEGDARLSELTLGLDELVEMGRRFSVSPGGPNDIAEADNFVVRLSGGKRVLYEVKHGNGSLIPIGPGEQLSRLEQLLVDDGVDEVVFVIRDGLGPSAAKAIGDANARIALIPGLAPIRFIEGLGGFSN